MKKLILIVLSLSTLSFAGLAQRPVVSGISASSAAVNDTITITGSNLPTGTSAHVQFGAATGNLVSATSSQIKVAVPVGATYDGITVTNTTTGLSAKSATPFLLTLGGNGLDLAKLDVEQSAYGNAGMFDLCACDFNMDGLVDVVSSHTKGYRLSVFANKTTAGTAEILFIRATDINIGGYSSNVACGDMDGDGRPDLVITGEGPNGDRVYLYRNLSATAGAITFGSAPALNIPYSGAGRVVLQDLNADGKQDILLTNRNTNVVMIFKNASFPGTMQFDAQAQEITIAGATATYGIVAHDLDGDGLADLALTTLASNIYTLRNTSTANTISFSNGPTLAYTGELTELAAADLTGDGKLELAATDYINDALVVWPNNSSNGSLQFGTRAELKTAAPTTQGMPWGIRAGDIDGNGRSELMISHTSLPSLFIVSNAATDGSLQLQSITKVTNEKGRNLAYADFNKDGKPDLAYTGSLGNLRILRNKHCVEPRLSHSGTVTLCNGQKVTIKATNTLFATYTWTRNGVAMAATTPHITVADAGTYAVTVASTLDGCSRSSQTVQVVAGSGSSTTVAMDPIAPVCAGGSAQLKATVISGASYIWSGPNGFTTTTTTASHTLTNVQTSAAGSYSVVIKSGECQFTPAAQTLSVNAKPQPSITASSLAFCTGTVTLEAPAGFATYQWKLNGANYSGTGSNTNIITTSTAGNYSILVSNTTGCSGESAAVAISQTQVPVANFSAPSTACLEQGVKFQNTSTFANGQTPTYQWSFGDGRTSAEANPVYTYVTQGTYTVNLTVSYGSQSCSSSMSKTISVVASPVVDLISDASAIFCPGDSILLRLEGDVSSVLWSTGETSQNIWAKDATIYTAEITTGGGCVLERSIELGHLDPPQIILSASATSIHIGDSVEITAEGGIHYEWKNKDEIPDPLSGNVTVQPRQTTTYIVTGWGPNGCYASAEITIEVDNSLRIDPPKVFVPAVDGTWSIPNMELYPNVQLTIVNSLGRAIYTSKTYTNSWEGTEQGRPLEAGVYYYIFKDGKGKVVKTGSITLFR